MDVSNAINPVTKAPMSIGRILSLKYFIFFLITSIQFPDKSYLEFLLYKKWARFSSFLTG